MQEPVALRQAEEVANQRDVAEHIDQDDSNRADCSGKAIGTRCAWAEPDAHSKTNDQGKDGLSEDGGIGREPARVYTSKDAGKNVIAAHRENDADGGVLDGEEAGEQARNGGEVDDLLQPGGIGMRERDDGVR